MSCLHSAESVALLLNLLWRTAHGLIGVRILDDHGESNSFLMDFRKVLAEYRDPGPDVTSKLDPQDIELIQRHVRPLSTLIEEAATSKDKDKIDRAYRAVNAFYDEVQRLASDVRGEVGPPRLGRK